MMTDAEKIGKKVLILLLEKGIVSGWWDRGAHKITYFIISQLFEYILEVVGKQEDTVKNALLSLDSQIFINEERKLLNFKKINRFLKNHPNRLLEIYDPFHVVKICERNNIKNLLFTILSHYSNIVNFSLINITNEIIVELFNYKENISSHCVILTRGLFTFTLQIVSHIYKKSSCMSLTYFRSIFHFYTP